MPLSRKVTAEFLGTFWLVFGGCGSAVLSAAFPALGIGFVGVALAFGLTLLTMAYAVGHISGCHLNPAVSIGLLVAKRFPASDLLPYVVAQVVGGIAAAAVLFVIASGKAGFDLADGFASNGYGAHSPGGYSLVACLVTELVLTFMFLIIILGRDRPPRAAGVCPHRHRPGPHPHSFNRHPRHKHVCEPRAKHWPGSFRRGLGASATLALLDSSDCGSCPGGSRLHCSLARKSYIGCSRCSGTISSFCYPCDFGTGPYLS